MDWETKVLMRVKHHVAMLTGSERGKVPGARHPGWEEASLVALRRSVRGLENE